MDNLIFVGEYGTFENCRIIKDTYANGGICLMLVDEEGPIATCTINVPEVKLGNNEVIIKDYSENKGILNFLVTNGIVEKPAQAVRISPWVVAPICKVLI